MRLSRLIPGASLVLALAAVGCGDSTGTNTITMTQAEAGEVVVAAFEALAGGNVSISRTATNGMSLSRTPRFNSANLLNSISATVNCTPSGNIKVDGTDTENGTSSFSFDLTAVYNSCTTTHFVLSGTLTFSGSGTNTSGTFTIKGTLHITGTKSGDCVIDWTITASGNSATSSGTICGQDASGAA